MFRYYLITFLYKTDNHIGYSNMTTRALGHLNIKSALDEFQNKYKCTQPTILSVSKISRQTFNSAQEVK